MNKLVAGMIGLVGMLAFSQALGWYYFVTVDARGQLGVAIVFQSVAAMALAVGSVVFIARYNVPRWLSVAVVINGFLLIIVDFGSIYWSIGTTANFSENLSKVGALYFALGTLTTAGTGSIAPINDLSRGLVDIQMVLDFGFIGVAVAIAVSKWGERRRKKI